MRFDSESTVQRLSRGAGFAMPDSINCLSEDCAFGGRRGRRDCFVFCFSREKVDRIDSSRLSVCSIKRTKINRL